MTGQETVDVLERVWRDLDGLFASLDDAQWALPTECPGWTVQDNLAHLCGTESRLLGRPMPDHVVEHAPHVRNPLGAVNEVEVDWRRSWSPQRVLAEFRELVAERLAVLRATSEEDFVAEVQGPIGAMTLQGFMALRAFDGWVHDQDVRRAVGRPGDWDSPEAPLAIERLASGMPRVVGRNAGDGTVVVFEVEGPAARTVAVAVSGGRGAPLPAAPDVHTARLRMDSETFLRIAGGRTDGAVARERGLVTVEGDEDVAGRVLAAMNVLI